ncbi:VOC family protein [Evansella sp. AB-rgal1]|uniref:VOC family protein n=1 Tax=Evansella sp. AB-rgal1 TaxID=3242696 RepID=UPI00359D38AD
MVQKEISPKIGIGKIKLTVQNIQDSIDFYTKLLGFTVLDKCDDFVSLTADGKTTLVELREQSDATINQHRTTGLYHFAILVPNRKELAISLQHLLNSQYRLDGASDHLFSEAVYLRDPDGHGIEIYADRPKESWKVNQDGTLAVASDPLDVQGLLAEAIGENWSGLHQDTILGHVHVHVADMEKTKDFYHNILGFPIKIEIADHALFIAGGDYHHHLGLNTWAGVGAPQPPSSVVQMEYFTITVPSMEEMESIMGKLVQNDIEVENREGGLFGRDPSGNGILFVL